MKQYQNFGPSTANNKSQPARARCLLISKQICTQDMVNQTHRRESNDLLIKLTLFTSNLLSTNNPERVTSMMDLLETIKYYVLDFCNISYHS